MRKTVGTIALCVFVIILLLKVDFNSLRSWLSDISMPIRYGISREKNILVPMRDGIKLSTMVYRPLTSEGSYPVILIRTTYGGTNLDIAKYFVKNDYIVVVQNVRGRSNSQGDVYTPHRYSRTDGYDTIDWIIKQPWASGKVGTFGCSYLGENQIMLAAANHPNHIAMIAGGAGGAIGKAKESYDYFGVYENGVLNLASALGWFTAEGATHCNRTPRPDDYQEKMKTEMAGLPVAQLAKRIVPYKTGFDDIVSHPLTDRWWDKEGYINQGDTFSAATLHVNSWYDQTVLDTFRLAEYMADNAKNLRAKNQFILIDPGIHCSPGKLKDGLVRIGKMEIQYKSPDFRKIYLDWFDYWLKGKKVALPPRFHYFLIHANRWKTSSQWPPKNVNFRRFYLHNGSRLKQTTSKSISTAENRKDFDQFSYDPLDPVPTIGGAICCTYRAGDISGALDQSQLKNRTDVLIYSSNKLISDSDLIGNVKATLYVSTSAKDTDFTIKIVDQYPNGVAYNLQDGVVRLRYRESIERPKLAKPGKIYKIELQLRPIAYRFKKGHKIAVYISSSNFPRLARNLNTGGNEYTEKTTVVANNKVYRSREYASYIDLPFYTPKESP